MKRTGELRRTTPLARTGGLSRTKGLSPTSAKRKGLLRAYAAVRSEALVRDSERCQRCGSTQQLECHHKAGRVGSRLLALDNLVIVCRDCHVFLTEHPLQAYAEGFSERRVA